MRCARIARDRASEGQSSRRDVALAFATAQRASSAHRMSMQRGQHVSMPRCASIAFTYTLKLPVACAAGCTQPDLPKCYCLTAVGGAAAAAIVMQRPHFCSMLRLVAGAAASPAAEQRAHVAIGARRGVGGAVGAGQRQPRCAGIRVPPLHHARPPPPATLQAGCGTARIRAGCASASSHAVEPELALAPAPRQSASNGAPWKSSCPGSPCLCRWEAAAQCQPRATPQPAPPPSSPCRAA